MVPERSGALYRKVMFFVHHLHLEQWFSTWGHDSQKGCEPFSEVSRVPILCTQLCYIWFI